MNPYRNRLCRLTKQLSPEGSKYASVRSIPHAILAICNKKRCARIYLGTLDPKLKTAVEFRRGESMQFMEGLYKAYRR